MSRTQYTQVVPINGGKTQLWTVSVRKEGYICQVWSLDEDQLKELDKPLDDKARPAFLDTPDHVRTFAELEQGRDFFAGDGTSELVTQAQRFYDEISSDS